MILQSPFNYTGSKSNLIPQLKRYFPSDCSVVYDLFCGGGGFFVNAMDSFPKATIIANDIIKPLMSFYNWLSKTDFEEIKHTLNDNNIPKDNEELYYKLRDKFNHSQDKIDFFILTCACTNNMMRFNKKLKFNQTYGKRHYNINTEARLKAYHEKIYNNHQLDFVNDNFNKLYIPQDAFVYLDPPYLITEAGYNAYWSKELEEKLYDYIDELNKKHIKFMLSNVTKHKDKINPYLNRIQKYNVIKVDYDYYKVSRNKHVNNTEEVIVMNY